MELTTKFLCTGLSILRYFVCDHHLRSGRHKKNSLKKKKNFYLLLATSIIEEKSVEIWSLKKAMVAWLHLALISDTQVYTGIRKKKTTIFEVQLIRRGTQRLECAILLPPKAKHT